jgi:hypothetical protein
MVGECSGLSHTDHMYCLCVQVERLHWQRELKLWYGRQLPVRAEALQRWVQGEGQWPCYNMMRQLTLCTGRILHYVELLTPYLLQYWEIIGHAMAQAFSCQSVRGQGCRFDSRPVIVGFVVDNVALGQAVLWLLQFSPVIIIIITPMIHTHSHVCHHRSVLLATGSVIK